MEAEAFASLRQGMEALSSKNRLRLLSGLSEPRTVGEIHLTPTDGRGENSGRKMTSQGIRHHLAKLEEADLVRSEIQEKGRGRGRRLYTVNEPAVFGLLEELRRRLISGISGAEEQASPFKTRSLDVPDDTEAGSWKEGPKLVLLRGPQDDRVFDLREIETHPSSGRGWVIGRQPDVEVPLQFDPYLSAQNTEILREDEVYKVVSLRVSTNGTRLNGERLDPGEETVLEHGDLVKAGCSTLVFHQR